MPDVGVPSLWSVSSRAAESSGLGGVDPEQEQQLCSWRPVAHDPGRQEGFGFGPHPVQDHTGHVAAHPARAAECRRHKSRCRTKPDSDRVQQLHPRWRLAHGSGGSGGRSRCVQRHARGPLPP